MNTAIDLSQLSAPNILEPLDYETILSEMHTALLNKIEDYIIVESDPAYKILEVAAYRELLLRQRVNDASKSLLLAYAKGSDLDHLAALFGVKRQTIIAADHTRNPPVAEIMESDDRFRMRIPLSLEGHSTAGPVGAYKFHTFSVSAAVKDVAVLSPAPGQVDVIVLTASENGQPDDLLMKNVKDKLNDDDIRPLTDLVTVKAADIIEYHIKADITLNSGPGKSQIIENVYKNVKEFVEGEHQLGNEITISGIYAAMHQVGVKKVTLLSPENDIQVTSSQAAYCHPDNILINSITGLSS